MGVQVEANLPTGSGFVPITVFSDTLIGADQPLGAGNNWIPVFCLTNPGFPTATGWGGTDYSSGVNRGATGLQYRNGGGGGTGPIGGAIPIPLDYTHIANRNQFAELTPVSSTAGGGVICPVVAYTPNTNTMYALTVQGSGTVAGLIRINGAAFTAIGIAIAYNFLDVMRVEVDFTTTPGTSIVTAFKNGVQADQVLDNSVSKATTGIPGIFFLGNTAGNEIVVKNYSGGAL